MTELQRLARCLADDYQFECQGGPLRNCTEWRALCAAIDTLAVDPPPSGASPQAETLGDAVSALWRALCEGDGKHSEMLDRSIIATHLERYAAQKPALVAEAAQHQQEIAAKDKQLEQERLVNNRLRLSWREDVDEERAKLNHTRARLAAVEAERDKQAEQIATLADDCAAGEAENEGLLAKVRAAKVDCACELDNRGDVCMVHVPAVIAQKQRAEAAEASLAAVEGERDRLRDRVARALCVENPDGPVSDDALVEAADATLTQLLDFSRSALAAVDAEEELDGPMPEAMLARFLASPETTMRSLVRVTKAGIRARLQAALASPAPQEPSELERLTLRRVQQYLIDWKEYPEHQPFIELARAALTPQGQSTDGETR